MTEVTMLTLKEAAKKTGLSYNQLRLWCHQNRIIYIRCGNKFYVNYDRLIDYLNTGGK